MQNGHIESFNGRMPDELLSESLFFGFGLDHARSAIADEGTGSKQPGHIPPSAIRPRRHTPRTSPQRAPTLW
jgi:hypothetical protein